MCQSFDWSGSIAKPGINFETKHCLVFAIHEAESSIHRLILFARPGFMTNQEKELFSAVPANEFNTYWIPCTWFVFRLQQASKQGKLVSNYALETIMRVRIEPRCCSAHEYRQSLSPFSIQEFCEFRAKCGLLWCYDWVSIPMVYTQVKPCTYFTFRPGLTLVLST